MKILDLPKSPCPAKKPFFSQNNISNPDLNMPGRDKERTKNKSFKNVCIPTNTSALGE